MKTNTLYLLLILLLNVTLGGCASLGDKTSRVMLQNPATMEFVKCDVDEWGSSAAYERKDKCVKDYLDQGYVIWGEY